MMGENLITLITGLSRKIANVKENSNVLQKKGDASAVCALRRKAFDIIHNTRCPEADPSNECGIDWYPKILVEDYAYELVNKGETRASKLLFQNLAYFDDTIFSNLDDILAFLINLKGPFTEENIVYDHPFALSGDDYFFRNSNAFELLPKEHLEREKRLVTTNPVRKEEGQLFLDSFIEKRRKSVSQARQRCLQDFTDESSQSEPQSLAHGIPTTGQADLCSVSQVAEASQSPAAIKRDVQENIAALRDIAGSLQLDLEYEPLTFVDHYQNALENVKTANFELKKRPETIKKGGKLMLGIYLQNENMNQLIDPTYEAVELYHVSLEQYVDQVKFLLMGVEGRIFKYCESTHKFYMKVGTSVDGISPQSLNDFSIPFLKTGTNLKNLNASVKEGVSSCCGVLHPAFWNSVEDYLLRHCDAVVAIASDCRLIALRTASTDLHAAMAAVHTLCVPGVGGLPSGGQLLSYLFEACQSSVCGHVRNVVFSFLYDCCVAYFSKIVETWAFQGWVNCQESDQFVRINTDLSPARDRNCYLSVTFEEAHVPSFLAGLASKIFASGKAVWLLKLFDPENEVIYFLSAKKSPRMKLCLSDAELTELERNFANYEATINDLCGKNESFVTIRQMEQDEEEERYINMKAMQQQVTAKMEEKKASELDMKKKKLEERNKLLQEHMEAIHQKQAQKKTQQLEAKRLEIERIAKNEAERDKLVEEKKKEAKERYRILAQEAEQVKSHADWQSKRFEMQERREGFLKQDLLNENVAGVGNLLLDVEGNLIDPEADFENANILTGVPLDNQTEREATAEGILDTEGNKQKSWTSQIEVCDARSDEPMIEKALPNDTRQMLDAAGPEERHSQLRNERKNAESHEQYLSSENNDQVQSQAVKQGLKTIIDEATRNKKNSGISGELAHSWSKNLTDAVKNQIKIMGPSVERVSNPSQEFAPLTEAQRNKLKVLSTVYNLPPVVEARNVGELSDLQKNRIKMHKVDAMEDTAIPQRVWTRGRETAKTSLGIGFDVEQQSDCIKFCEAPPEEVDEKEESQREVIVVPELFELRKPREAYVNVRDVKADPSLLFPSFPHVPARTTKPTLDHLPITMLARYLQTSVNIAISVQERLANGAVLKHLLLKENLMTHITSLRCYFFLHDGEFSRSLSNGLFHALAESSEPHQFFDRSLLSGILNEALIYTSHKTNAQNLSFQIVRMPTQLKHEVHDALTPFQLSYKAKWPLNIIITDASLDRYRKVFHVLINLKRVHWTLNETFLLLKTQTKDKALDGKRLMNSPEYTKLATFRHAMTLFIMTLEEHVCANGPQEAWATFIQTLETVRDLDDLYQKHVALVKDVFRRCFLVKASQDLLSYINELIELGLNFHHVLKSCSWRLINDIHYGHPKYGTLKSIFNRFCVTTKLFNRTLRKKTSHPEMKIHIPMLELIDLKIKV